MSELIVFSLGIASLGSQRIRCASRRLRTEVERGAVWCIFDNTAAGVAVGNALALLEKLTPEEV